MRRGAFPGSFNPPTVAHLDIARAARHQGRLDRVDLVLSRAPLGKPKIERPCFDDRVDVVRRVVTDEAGLHVVVTDAQLIADIARDYDAVIVGADKWHQILDPSFYGTAAERDEAVAALPTVYVVPREGWPVPAGVEVLTIDDEYGGVSSTAARAGQRRWMAPAAAEFDDATGAWSQPDRYDRWRAARDA